MRSRYGRLLAALTAAAVLVTAMPVAAAQDTSAIVEEAGYDSADPDIVDVITANDDPVMESATDILSAESAANIPSDENDPGIPVAVNETNEPAQTVEQDSEDEAPAYFSDDQGIFFEEVPEGFYDDEAINDAVTDSVEADEGYIYSDSYWDRYTSYYYYNQMSSDEKNFYDSLDKACRKVLSTNNDFTTVGATSTDGTYNWYQLPTASAKGLSDSSAQNVFWIFYYNNPQYYFVDNHIRWSGTTYYMMMGEEFHLGSDRARATAAMKSQLDSWMSEVNSQSSQIDKEKKAHDVISRDVRYQLGSPFNQSAYSAVVNHVSVCVGYAKTLDMLLNAAGVDSALVNSDNHAWNLVRANGTWYYIDVTWDDQEWGTRYDYFNRSASAIADSDHTPKSMWKKYLPSLTADSGGSAAGTASAQGTVSAPQDTQSKSGSNYKVTLSSDSGAKIWYTTDGTDPGSAYSKSLLYSNAITASNGAVIKARAEKSGYNDSQTVTINVGSGSDPVPEPEPIIPEPTPTPTPTPTPEPDDPDLQQFTIMVGQNVTTLHEADRSADDDFAYEYGEAARKRTIKYSPKPSGILGMSTKMVNGRKIQYFTGKKPGTAIIWVTRSWKNYKNERVLAAITVTKPEIAKADSKITINNLNTTFDMTSIVRWSNGVELPTYKVAWKSSNEAVAYVDDNGCVYFLKPGSAKITGTYTTGATGKATVTASFKVVVPSLSKTCVVLKPGKKATVTLKNVRKGATVSWSNTGYSGVWEGKTAGEMNEKLTITTSSKKNNGCVSITTATVDGMSFYLVIGKEMSAFDTFSVNGGNTVVGKYDYKATAEFVHQVICYRLANNLNPIINIGTLGSGASTRVKELPFRTEYWKRPDGSDSGTAYGESVKYQYEGVGPGGGKAAFDACMEKQLFVDYISSNSTTMVGVRFFETKQNYPIRLGNITRNFKRFIAVAYG